MLSPLLGALQQVGKVRKFATGHGGIVVTLNAA
jgi:hypothetical protein